MLCETFLSHIFCFFCRNTDPELNLGDLYPSLAITVALMKWDWKWAWARNHSLVLSVGVWEVHAISFAACILEHKE